MRIFSTILLGLFSGSVLVAQQNAPPEPPLTRAQLEKLLVLSMDSDEQTAASTHAQLEAKRKTLPAWFPKAVWDDVERKVEAIHYADVVYPVYAKHMSSEQAEVEILLFQGSIGQKIAAVLSGRGDAVASTGLRGSAADQAVSNELRGNTDFQSLMRQRFSEMSPEQRTRVNAALPGIRAITPTIDDEEHKAYFVRSNEVVQATMKAHQAEIARAQQAAH